MNNLKYALVCIATLLLAACQSPKEKALEHIRSLEQSDSLFNISQMTELYWSYIDFADKYPDDERAPDFLFKAGQRSKLLIKSNEGINLFERIIKNYPKSALCEQALISMAYFYENDLNDLEKARLFYTRFIENYPASELASSAQFALKNLGKSPEDVFEEAVKDTAVVDED